MMAALQPFLSGASSKTVNLPNSATVDDILHIYVEAWRLGIKALAVYRDGSKRSQPLNTKLTRDDAGDAKIDQESPRLKELEAEIARLKELSAKPTRRRLPETRQALTHKFDIAGHEGYLTVGLFEDRQPGEMFITMAKEGSTIGGLMDSVGTLTSMALQYGVPLDVLVKKFSYQHFEPSGFTQSSRIRQASSIIDYVFRWLEAEFLKPQVETIPMPKPEELGQDIDTLLGEPELPKIKVYQTDAPLCSRCGHQQVRSGTCYRCLNCGDASGACG